MNEVLQIKDTGKSFGKTEVLKHIDFSMQKGEVYGLVGQNGAGKTTLLRLIAGLMKPSYGSIRLLAGKRYIGYMPQSCRFDDRTTVRGTIRFFAGVRGADAEESFELLKKLELEDTKKVKHLSPGQQKKMQMAIAMTGDPDFFILDEPTAGLDPKASGEIIRMIRALQAKGKSILLSSHILQNMDDVCTNVAIMENGRLVYDRMIEESYIIKTSPLTDTALSAIRSGYDIGLSADRSVMTLKTDPAGVSDFIKFLVSLSVDIRGVTGSNVHHIVQQQMNGKGAAV
jgi:ABC-type multidrug transport system ATPase subunit